MKPRKLFFISLALALPALVFGQAVDPDPNGILRKRIPDRLIVLTFDDGPASHATVVAPILKEFGFGGSFYVCDFDSFHTRKDWYLTYRQMKAMSAAGLEIGNHTRGHAGGASIGPFLDMEDQLIANGVPKPTTIAWPVYPGQWCGGGELRLHVGAPGAFTAEHDGTMLRELATGVNQNGMLAGATFCLDTTGAPIVQELATNIADSKGPGAEAFT